MMLDAIEAARYNDQETVTEALRSFAERLDELGSLLTQMYENCDPHVFYHKIRPLLAGSKNMADAGLPDGVIFDTGSGNDGYVQFSGGSNAQSSIIQFFDIILGIGHRPTGFTPASADVTTHGAPSNSFIHEMRAYMPGPHRRFLQHVERVANIHDFVTAHPENRALSTAYDACLAMLRAFRDTHIQMVSRYIVIKSREGSRSGNSQSPPGNQHQTKRMNLALASSDGGSTGTINTRESRSLKRLRGTGGTALIPFLKQARDETGEPAIDAWARRLLNNGPGTVVSSSSNHFFPGQSKLNGNGNEWTVGAARLSKIGEHASGEREIVGLAGVWSVDDSEGGICHW
jgi:indoleamine 2,3-dioxygenase